MFIFVSEIPNQVHVIILSLNNFKKITQIFRINFMFTQLLFDHYITAVQRGVVVGAATRSGLY